MLDKSVELNSNAGTSLENPHQLRSRFPKDCLHPYEPAGAQTFSMENHRSPSAEGGNLIGNHSSGNLVCGQVVLQKNLISAPESLQAEQQHHFHIKPNNFQQDDRLPTQKWRTVSAKRFLQNLLLPGVVRT